MGRETKRAWERETHTHTHLYLAVAKLLAVGQSLKEMLTTMPDVFFFFFFKFI